MPVAPMDIQRNIAPFCDSESTLQNTSFPVGNARYYRIPIIENCLPPYPVPAAGGWPILLNSEN